MVRLTREFACELVQLAPMRSFILKECRTAWGSQHEDVLDELLLAVQETGTNIVRHGYHDEARRPIRLALDVQPDQVSLSFSYPGRDFDPDKVPPPVFDGTRSGGFGVYLIRQLVDEVSYSRDSAGLCAVRLVKKRYPFTPQEQQPCK